MISRSVRGMGRPGTSSARFHSRVPSSNRVLAHGALMRALAAGDVDLAPDGRVHADIGLLVAVQQQQPPLVVIEIAEDGDLIRQAMSHEP
jgi:hypothetical protein